MKTKRKRTIGDALADDTFWLGFVIGVVTTLFIRLIGAFL